MQKSNTTMFMSAMFVGLAMGHGFLVTPPSRRGGSAYAAACGGAIAAQDTKDYTQEVQTLGKSPGPACDLNFCKG